MSSRHERVGEGGFEVKGIGSEAQDRKITPRNIKKETQSKERSRGILGPRRSYQKERDLYKERHVRRPQG